MILMTVTCLVSTYDELMTNFVAIDFALPIEIDLPAQTSPSQTEDFIDINIHIQDNVFTPIEKFSVMFQQLFHSQNLSRESRRAIIHIVNEMLASKNLGMYYI